MCKEVPTRTGASSSSGKGLTAVSTAIWVRIPTTGELTVRHRQGHKTDTWQHVTSLHHLCGARISLYNSKKEVPTSTQPQVIYYTTRCFVSILQSRIYKKKNQKKTTETNQPSVNRSIPRGHTNLKDGPKEKQSKEMIHQAVAVGEGWNAIPQAIQSLFLPPGTVQPGTLAHSLVTAL